MKSAVIDYWTLRAPLVLFFSEDRGAYEPADSKLLAGCTIGEGEPVSCGQVPLDNQETASHYTIYNIIKMLSINYFTVTAPILVHNPTVLC